MNIENIEHLTSIAFADAVQK